MTNHQTGHDAEKLAAEYLQEQGYKIIELNWKTRLCEIDIVAQKKTVVWFVEVKYRKNSRHGYGYEYVTPKKLDQMRFAAAMWVQSHKWSGDYRLGVISIDGDKIEFIRDIELS